MAGKERAEVLALDEILGLIPGKYEISPLPPMDAAVNFLNHTASSLSLRKAFDLPPR